MEFLLLVFVGVTLILVIGLGSRLSKVTREVEETKDKAEAVLLILKAQREKERAKELREEVAKGEGEDRSAGEKEKEQEQEQEQEPEKETDREKEKEGGAMPPPLPKAREVEKAPPPVGEKVGPEPAPAAAMVETPKEPSKFETAAKEILARIWNWIVVGEEHRPSGVTMEYAVATTWLLRSGVLILLVGIGFFLKYSITEGLIGPLGRVALATLAGLGLLGGGLKLFGGRYSLLGQGLAGAGFATLYFSFYTAHEYDLIGAPIAFGVMILVTIAAGFVAVRTKSLLVAILGLAGGYLTPIMISSGEAGVVALFSYVLLLGGGVFFIAAKRDWRLLHYLSFAATWLLVLMAVDRGFEPERFWEYFPFLLGYFLLFSTVTFLHQLVHKNKSTVLELLFLFLNAGVFLGFTIHLFDRTWPREALAIVTLGLAAFYIAHITLFLKREILDRGLLMSFIGLASFFVAMTLPLVLSEGWITVSWAIQGFVMLWIAAKLRSEFLRQLAYLLYLIVLARFAIFDLHGQFGGWGRELSAKDYWLGLLERIMVFGVPIASFFAAGRLFSRERASESQWIVAEDNDIRPWFGQSLLGRVCFWVVVALGFVYLNLEIWFSFENFYEPLVLPGLTLAWIALGMILLREMLANRHTVATVFFWIVAAAIVLKVFFFDMMFWRPDFDLAFSRNGTVDGLLMRLLDYGSVVAFLLIVWRIFSGRDGRGGLATTFGYAALAGTFLYSSLEIWTALTRFLPEFRMGGISIYWSLFALGLLLTGISKSRTALRRIGLVLMAGTIVKVFLVDLAGLEQLYRIIAFIVLGVIVLVCSFLYLKYRHRFLTEEEKEEPSGAGADAEADAATDPENES